MESASVGRVGNEVVDSSPARNPTHDHEFQFQGYRQGLSGT